MPHSKSRMVTGRAATAARSVIKFQLVLLAALCLSAPAAAQTVTYTLTDLGTLGGESSIAMSINNFGEVVGNASAADGKARAFLYSRGEMIDLGLPPGALESRAVRIIDSGAIVGSAVYSVRSSRPFLTRLGGLWPLQVIQTDSNSTSEAAPKVLAPALTFSHACDVNSGGYVVGYNAYDPVAGPGAGPRGGHSPGVEYARRRAFLYSEARLSFLPDLGMGESFATAINDSGQIVGYGKRHVGKRGLFAFLYDSGAASELGGLGGAITVPARISNTGFVVGYGQVSDGAEHAFLYRGGKMTDLGTLPGGRHSSAYGVNNFGRAVGSATSPGGEHRAFVYARGGLRDLNELVRGAAGWLLIEARDINDWGQIVGAGVVNGQTRAFLLTPARTPSQTVEELADALTRLDIPEPYAGRLRFRLTQAHAALDRATPGDGLAAAEALDEFVTLLSAHAGRELSEAQVGPLIAMTHRLRSVLRPADGTRLSGRSRYSRLAPTQSGHAATAGTGFPNTASAGTRKR